MSDIPFDSVLQVVLNTLRSRQIVENPGANTPLTARFAQVFDQDNKAPNAPNRIFEFVHALKDQLRWDWDLGPSDLLDGTLRTPSEIAHRAFDVLPA